MPAEKLYKVKLVSSWKAYNPGETCMVNLKTMRELSERNVIELTGEDKIRNAEAKIKSMKQKLHKAESELAFLKKGEVSKEVEDKPEAKAKAKSPAERRPKAGAKKDAGEES